MKCLITVQDVGEYSSNRGPNATWVVYEEVLTAVCLESSNSPEL